MPVPDVLGPATPVTIFPQHRRGTPASAMAAGITASPSTQPSRILLNYRLDVQEQDRWCWAAVSLSVSYYYNQQTGWTQCAIADTALNKTNCCSNGSACDQEWYLEDALRITENFLNILSRSLQLDEIINEIKYGRPICCRIHWHDEEQRAHFAAITGYIVGSYGDKYLEIDDPFYLNSRVNYALFPKLYKSGGSWTHSYFTCPVPTLGGAGGLSSASARHVLHREAIGG